MKTSLAAMSMVFLDGALGTAIVRLLLRRKGLAEDAVSETDAQAYKQEQYNALADALCASLDLAQIYRIMGLDGIAAKRDKGSMPGFR